MKIHEQLIQFSGSLNGMNWYIDQLGVRRRASQSSMAQILRMGNQSYEEHEILEISNSGNPPWILDLEALCYYVTQQLGEVSEIVFAPLDWLKGEARYTRTKRIIGLPADIEAECMVVPSQFVEISSTRSFQFNFVEALNSRQLNIHTGKIEFNEPFFIIRSGDDIALVNQITFKSKATKRADLTIVARSEYGIMTNTETRKVSGSLGPSIGGQSIGGYGAYVLKDGKVTWSAGAQVQLRSGSEGLRLRFGPTW